MYKRLDLTQLDGLGLTQEMLDFMQTSYRDSISTIADLFGDNVIVGGVQVSGGSYTSGWVVISGELLPFVGGTIQANIVVDQIVTNEDFADGSSKPVNYLRRAILSSSSGTPVASFYRLSTVKQICQDLGIKAPINSPALTGTPTAPTASLGTNTTQLATTAYVVSAINALIAAAPGALDTLNELAAALGNDPNFATTITTLIGTKADKAITISAGSGLSGGGSLSADRTLNVNVDNSTIEISSNNLQVKNGSITASKLASGSAEANIGYSNIELSIGDWNMDVNAIKSVPHGLSSTDRKKIRKITTLIRDDSDSSLYPVPCYTGISTEADVSYYILSGSCIDDTNIKLARKDTGFFDSTNFDSTGFNRGFITIELKNF